MELDILKGRGTEYCSKDREYLSSSQRYRNSGSRTSVSILKTSSKGSRAQYLPVSVSMQTMKRALRSTVAPPHRECSEEIPWQEILARISAMDLIIQFERYLCPSNHRTMERVRACPRRRDGHSPSACGETQYLRGATRTKIRTLREMISLTAKYAREMGREPYYLYRQKNMARSEECRLCGAGKHVSQYPHYGEKQTVRSLRCRNHHEVTFRQKAVWNARGGMRKGCGFLCREDR